MRRVATSSKFTRRPHTATVRRFGCKPEASSESSARRCINSPASLNLLAGCGAEGSPTLSPSGLFKCSTYAWAGLSRTRRSGKASVRILPRCLSARLRTACIHAGADMGDCSGSMEPQRVIKSGLSASCNYA